MTEIVGRKRKARKPPVEMDLSLVDWATRGSTRADGDGRRILVDRGIPGERVLATVDRRRQPWRGVVDHVLEPSPQRVHPPCPYYTRGCGGCQWQHMRYEAQVETKRALVDREMAGVGLDVRVRDAHAMDEPWRYRHTAALAIGWEAGFRPRARRGILEIHDCPIAHPLIGQLADRLNDLLRRHELPNYHGKVWLDCAVVGTRVHPRLQVVIQGIEGLTIEGHPELPEVAEQVASLDGVGAVAFRHHSGTVQPLVGPLLDTIEIAGRDMYLPAGSFVQTNIEMVPVVLDRMRGILTRREIRHAADIYGGIGTFGLPLASSVDRLTLVELDAAAVEAARKTVDAWELRNVELVSRHAERALPDLPALDLAIVDPPRSGLGDVVVDALIANGVPSVFYVSCSPQSLARDLAALSAGGYTVRSLDIFDFYPQTYHVESLAVLERC